VTPPATGGGAVALTAADIVKTYPGVRALAGVGLELRAGEIHAVMGENGSGKSTLLSILSGAQQPDSGAILIDGKIYSGLAPAEARALGIALVHQEPQLAPALTVGENIMLGRLPARRGLIGWAGLHRRAQTLLDECGFSVSSRAIVGGLSTGRRQLVEIAKGLVDRPRVLLLDEATSSLDDDDVSALFALLRTMRAQGTAIAFISHRMREVMTLADRATVLRDGQYVGTVNVVDSDERAIVSMMVGRDLDSYWHKADVPAGAPVLEVRNVTRGPLRDISLTVRRGEVVGLAGLVGSGRSALMRTLMGVKPARTGTIEVAGRPVRIRNPRDAHRFGLAYVPEDRKSEGLVLGWSILRNVALARMNDRRPWSFLGNGFDRSALLDGGTGLEIKSSSPAQVVGQLSGGNQQKVLLARELATAPDLLLLDEPTRGVDVGAKEDIYAQIAELVRGGMGLLVTSSELPELLGVCDRIYVLFRGRIVAEFDAASATEETITFRASGAHEVGTDKDAA
jgi:ABC-type sugar transport system ATPase subunit